MMSDDNRIDFPKKVANDAERQMPAFKGPICRGSYVLNSACGRCERCEWERAQMRPAGPPPKPELLKVPDKFQSVEEVLACAEKMDLPNIIVLSALENGNLVMLHHDMERAEMNLLLDRVKMILLNAVDHSKVK
jgi:hypothetical protein